MLATVPSVTTAMRVRNILAQNNIKVEVMQTPHTISKWGCSYSVKFADENLEAVKAAVKSVNSTVTAIYNDRGEKLDLS